MILLYKTLIIKKTMAEENKIIKLVLLKNVKEQGRFITDEESLANAGQGDGTISTLHVFGGSLEFSYIRPDPDLYIAPVSHYMLDTDYFEYLEAVKIKSVRHRSSWLDAPDADSILNDAEKKLHKYERSYPGLMEFISSAESYDGNWEPVSPASPG